MYRRPSTQDISWFLDLFDRKQLDLEPPYQRKSVWSPKDKKFFIDTIFRNYPSPAIFLHKSINDQGQSLYHVVDGKQRLSTIIDFVQDKIKIDVEFGDDLEKYTNSTSSNFGLFSYSKNQKIYNKTLFCILQKSIPLYDLFCNWKLNLS